ncbi:ATP-binding protein [Acidobacteriota bacterium]
MFQSKEKNITLYFDPEKLEEVFSNLVSNALKFTPAGGVIILSVKTGKTTQGPKQPGFVEVSLADTGPGIPPEELAFIFDRFYQADATYEFHRKGTGIGLAIAKEMVELHRGTITVHNAEGGSSGARFVVLLPLGKTHLKPEEIVDSPAGPRKTEAAREPVIISPHEKVEEEDESDMREKGSNLVEQAGRHKKDIVLVVEDNADVREYIRGTLMPLYDVVEAAKGEEGFEQAKEIIPDLIISDIMMPGIDGTEFCRLLKKEILTSHIPVILLTAKAGEADIIRGLEIGVDDYIIKPFNTRVLLARIKNLIDICVQLQENVKREMARQPVKTVLSRVDREFLQELQTLIEANFSDPDFNVEQLCRKLFMSRVSLYRKILALTGETPTEFIRSLRLRKGAELLKSNFGTVLEVALEVGFSSANYFTKCFKKKFHQLPIEY